MQKIERNKSTPVKITITLSVVVLIFLAASYGYRGSSGDYRSHGPNAQKISCEKKCQQEGLSGRLVPALAIRPANPFAYNGPWKCECMELQEGPQR